MGWTSALRAPACAGGVKWQMNIKVLKQVEVSLERYLSKELPGEDLANSISLNLLSLEGTSKIQKDAIEYYVNFFEMEGSSFYESNKYIDEEVSELGELLSELQD